MIKKLQLSIRSQNSLQIYDFFLIYELSRNYFLFLQAIRTMRCRFSVLLLLLLGAAVPLYGQSWLARGDSLQRAYRFQEALTEYFSIPAASLSAADRQVLERRIEAAQNALGMTDFCADPHVVARQRFSRDDFFLYYPLKAQSWHPSPNPLDSAALYPLYHPKGDDVIYFSARDRAGTRSLFLTEDLESEWRAPRLVGEALLSTGSEIFPMLSPDGNTLYFASDGLFGMGGYDLYASAWDAETQTWGEPVNMGFPFSSPADDFLLMDTEDGQYTLFASNRDCGPDSVYVYVLEYETSRQRKQVMNHDELLRIAALRPVEDPSRLDNASAVSEAVPTNANTRLYVRKMEEARALRDSIYRLDKTLDALRILLSVAREDETAGLTARIRAKEAERPPLQLLLEETQLEIRLVEQTFLQSGVVSTSGSEDREVVGADRSYTFSKKAMGGPLRFKVGRHPVRTTFRVTPVGRFAPDNTLPAGLVYQIQLFTSPRHATLDDINGLSPVYERLASNLRYTYCVGTYPTYVSALLDLNIVRRLGFPEARIVAYRDGRSIPVSTARQEE